MSELKRTLYDVYNGFSDKRIKNLESGDTFIIDDRGPSDIGADNQLYSYFCLLFATVLDESHTQIVLRGNIPESDEINAWLDDNGAERNEGNQLSITFVIERGQQGRLSELAKAIMSIVASGKRYSVANYKYVCPRTAGSIERLKTVLDTVWGT